MKGNNAGGLLIIGGVVIAVIIVAVLLVKKSAPQQQQITLQKPSSNVFDAIAGAGPSLIDGVFGLFGGGKKKTATVDGGCGPGKRFDAPTGDCVDE